MALDFVHDFFQWTDVTSHSAAQLSKGKLTHRYTVSATVKDTRFTPPDDTQGANMMKVM